MERDTGEAMSSLERLDIAKSRLQSSKEALHEADNWTALSTDIEEVVYLLEADTQVVGEST